MKLSREQIERAADAIKFMVPLDMRPGPGWTAKGGVTETTWSNGFSRVEQQTLRGIARAALEAAHDEHEAT